MTWRTMKQWNKRGKYITKGEKCRLRDPDGVCLWHKDQVENSINRTYTDYERYEQDEQVDYDYDDPMAWECPINC